MTNQDAQQQKPEPQEKRYVDPFEILAGVVLGWGVLCLIGLLYLGKLPRSHREWIAFILSAPLLVVGFHVFGEGLFYSPEEGDELYGDPGSLRRIAVRSVCLIGLVVTVLVAIVAWKWGTGS